MRVRLGVLGGRRSVDAIGPCFLQLSFFRRGFDRTQFATRFAIFSILPRLAEFSDPPAELVRVEMAVAAIRQRCKSALLECQKRTVRPLGGTSGIPSACCCPDRAHTASRKQAHDVHLVRRLTPNNASALRRIELLRPAGTVEKIRVVQCGDHPDSSEVAFLNYLTSPQVGSVKAVAVADDDLYSSAPRGFDHCAAFGQAEGHRLFDQDMLACASSKFDVLYVKLMGSRDVNRLHLRISAKLPDGFEGAGVEIGREPYASLRTGVGGGNQFEFWMLRER